MMKVMLRFGVVVVCVWVGAGFTGCGGSAFTGDEASGAGGGDASTTGGQAGSSARGGSGGGLGSAGKSGTGGANGSGGAGASGGGVGSGGNGGRAGSGGVGAGGALGAGGNLGNAGMGGVPDAGSGCVATGRGPAVIEVITASGRICVDATEVTNAQYGAFLASSPATTAQPALCSFNTDFKPSAGWPPPVDRANFPVAFVDWCDARAFCLWAGKRLCGKIGGGSNGINDYADASKSQWYAACSAGGGRAYPYGATYDGNKCNGADYPGTGAIAVGSAIGCEAAYPGLRDLSGNVWEWEDSCSGDGGSNDTCHARGGYYESTPTSLRCDYDQRFYRNAAAVTDGYLGFRCCGP